MRPVNILDKISDGKLYDIEDMVKADTCGCNGCSDCCKDVGDLVMLTPFDVNEIVNFLGIGFNELLGDKIELRESNKILLPYLKMQKSKYCSFLNKEGRCMIHSKRPNICRLFPLGRVYKDDDFKYFLQIGNCPKENLKDVKVSKWLGIENYDENKKGAFVPYNTKTSKGEKVKGNILGNGAIIEFNIESKKKQLYSYGIRNVKGFDLNSSGEIFAIVGGMEEEGYRPLSEDSDYIYKIEGKGTWYGWPDYSGGDPVNSPRFREEGKPIINFITDEHKSYVMPKPLYQSEGTRNINTLLIDREGTILGDENSFLFFNNKNNTLSKLLKEGEVKELIYLDKNSYINDMKIIGDNLYILDGNKGVLFRLEKSNTINNIPIYNY